MSLLKVNEIQVFNGTTVTITATTAIASADLTVTDDLDVGGALTLGTALAIAEGGTGATSAAAARTALDVDQAGTDNSTDVTLAGSLDYLTISGQQITRNAIVLTTDVSGALPIANGGTGSTTAANARTALGSGAVGDNVFTAATASAAQQAMDTEVGVDVQAYDAGLQSISSLTTAADKMIYTTASDTYAVTDLTSAGRALLDDADAAAQRTTLGLGTAATTASTDYATAAQGSTADSAVQPGDNANTLGSGTATDGYVLTADGAGGAAWEAVSAGGGTDVTLAGSLDYLTISGQEITRNAIDLTTDITGTLPIASGGTGATTASAARIALGLEIGTDVQSYDADTTKNDVSNTFSANQIISVESASAALRITQTGAGNALVVEDTTNPDSTPFVINAVGQVGIGTDSPTEKLDVTGNINASGTLTLGTALAVAEGGTGVTALGSLDAADLGSGAATDGYVLTADGAGGAAWEVASGGSSGKVLQVVGTVKADTFSASLASGAETDITGYSATITPSSTASKILVLVSAHMFNGSEGGGGLTIHRNGSIILPSDDAGSQGRLNSHSIGVTNTAISDSVHFVGLDSPNSTSAQVYQVRFHNIASITRTMYLNRASAATLRYYASSTITLMEIAG